MREILFRGKRVDNGEWLYGFYHNETSIESAASDRKITHHHIYTQDFDLLVDPDTVGQYTGLKDKKGTKIFEGDIIKIRKDTDFYGKPITFKGVVFFNEDECGFEIGKNGMKGYCISSLASYIFKSSATEIIGNFYDNPELLGKMEEK